MANKEHLKILKRGVEVWNQWREENPETRLDLRGADLSRADLRTGDLHKVNLTNANLFLAHLSRADLRGAILHGAYLRGAAFHGADLSRAELREAELREANLREANLREANLREANLREANLSGANLNEAYFIWATLSEADLSGADLSGARLSGANLSSAHLSRARLRKAYLRGADLRKADLRGADLSGADLSGANLSGARVSETVFADLDLSAAEGLEAIEHWGPSFIDIHTIYTSGGQIPEIFLRGAGVPDTFIAYVASLTREVIQYYSCFISYSSKDDAFAQRLHADLQQNNVRCWFAPEDMKIGDDIWARIDQTIRVHDKLLVVLSENSISSSWVKDEVESAFEEERRRDQTILFPVMLDHAVMVTDKPWAAKIRRRHIGDFTHWKDHDSYQHALDRLLRDLKASEA
jgi:uncharacterized protein YjbI with pentapeptide repeats